MFEEACYLRLIHHDYRHYGACQSSADFEGFYLFPLFLPLIVYAMRLPMTCSMPLLAVQPLTMVLSPLYSHQLHLELLLLLICRHVP